MGDGRHTVGTRDASRRGFGGGVLLLGGSGLIGSALRSGLAGREVRAPSSRRIDLARPDPPGLDALDLGPADAVVMAAAVTRSREDSLRAFQCNLCMVRNLAGLVARRRPAAVLFLSSVDVYRADARLPIDESSPLAPRTLYGAGKLAAETLLGRACDRAGARLVCLRLPGVYGASLDERSLVARLSARLLRGEEIRLRRAGKLLRDLVLVDDLPRVVGACLAGSISGPLNVATGRSMELLEMVTRLAGGIGVPPRLRLDDGGPGEDRVFDVACLRAACPGLALTPLEVGLARSVPRFLGAAGPKGPVPGSPRPGNGTSRDAARPAAGGS